ncbi:hypothetical protein J6590_065727 [Homalodisca vitripennis]|nr:hypothetical protein J6590_065727 [Homalodisca vitripennis]
MMGSEKSDNSSIFPKSARRSCELVMSSPITAVLQKYMARPAWQSPYVVLDGEGGILPPRGRKINL